MIELKHLPSARWEILRTLGIGGHVGATDVMILSVVSAAFLTSDRTDVRNELVYLEDRKLVKLECHEFHPWRAVLTRYGRDIVDYTVECRAGIHRPPNPAAKG